MAGVPINFNIPGEPAVASYDWTDVASGTGMITFYLGGLKDSTGIGYILYENVFIPNKERNTTSFNSQGRFTRVETDVAVFTKVIDLSFDLSSFNTPRTLGGTCLFEIPCSSDILSSDRATEHYIICKVQNSTTVLLTSQSATRAPGTGVSEQEYFCWRGTLPQSNFKRGETLRLVVEVWGRRSAGGSENVAFMLGHDPLNDECPLIDTSSAIKKVNIADGKSQAKVTIPFKLDL